MSHVNKVQPIRVKNDTLSSNTCNMYMSDLRHIHDPVLSSLKMEGIRLSFLYVFLLRRTADRKAFHTPLRFLFSPTISCQ
jgi:hypothetical protein